MTLLGWYNDRLFIEPYDIINRGRIRGLILLNLSINRDKQITPLLYVSLTPDRHLPPPQGMGAKMP